MDERGDYEEDPQDVEMPEQLKQEELLEDTNEKPRKKKKKKKKDKSVSQEGNILNNSEPQCPDEAARDTDPSSTMTYLTVDHDYAFPMIIHKTMFKRRRGQGCSAHNCANTRVNCPGKAFFRFPKDPDRCKKWIVNSRRHDLMKKTPSALNDSYAFCADHFEDIMFTNWQERKRIYRHSFPTIFDVPNPPKRVMLKPRSAIMKMEAAREKIAAKRAIAASLKKEKAVAEAAGKPGSASTDAVNIKVPVVDKHTAGQRLNYTSQSQYLDSLPQKEPDKSNFLPTKGLSYSFPLPLEGLQDSVLMPAEELENPSLPVVQSSPPAALPEEGPSEDDNLNDNLSDEFDDEPAATTKREDGRTQSEYINSILPDSAHKMWNSACQYATAAAVAKARASYYRNEITHGNIEGWCAGLLDNPEWIPGMESLKKKMLERRRYCAMDIMKDAERHLLQAHADCLKTKGSALDSVAGALVKHKSLAEAKAIMDIVCKTVTKSQCDEYSKQTLHYQDRHDTIEQRIPQDNDFINPTAGIKRLQVEQAARRSEKQISQSMKHNENDISADFKARKQKQGSGQEKFMICLQFKDNSQECLTICR